MKGYHDYVFLFSFLLISNVCPAQEKIEGSFAFENDPEKKYALYVPSSYTEGTPNALMLGLHPFNVNRWDAISWRDTLTAFAEENQLVLLCPDGGDDGKVDDEIDTAFTSFLLDTIMSSYSIDHNNIYCMGFSWGGRTSYTYALNHPGIFKGVMPIGAAIDGTSLIDNVSSNASLMDFYVVHGSLDATNTRYFPLLEYLEDHDACHETILLNGVGHTIDFDNRNTILSEAYQWLKGDNCFSSVQNVNQSIIISPNPARSGQKISFSEMGSIQLFDSKGTLICSELSSNTLAIPSNIQAGIYYVRLSSANKAPNVSPLFIMGS